MKFYIEMRAAQHRLIMKDLEDKRNGPFRTPAKQTLNYIQLFKRGGRLPNVTILL